MKKAFLEIELGRENVLLLPQKAMYRESCDQLIISDLHLGKTTHFRKQGIALPEKGLLRDIDRLHFLLKLWKPKAVLLLGDLFHSDYNKEWRLFKALLEQYGQVQFVLVEGNHDILKKADYDLPNFIKTGYMEEEDFIFTHHPMDSVEKINICGHIHPGIYIEGKARQYVKLPCFYHNDQSFIMPAFGALTGLQIMKDVKDKKIYAVTEQEVIPLIL